MSAQTFRYYVTLKGEESVVDLSENGDGSVHVELDGQPVTADLTRLESSLYSLLLDGHSREMVLERDGERVAVYLDGERVDTVVRDELSRALSAVAGPGAAGPSEVLAPMPGVVVAIPVQPGDEVTAGQAVIVVEAMKMQNELSAEADGVVASIEVEVGTTVSGGDVLVRLEARS